MNHYKSYGDNVICRVYLGLAWIVVLTSTIFAQQRAGVPQPERPTVPVSQPDQGSVSVLTDSGNDYLISTGDVIEVKVEDAPELSHHYRVNAKGDIEIPVLGIVVARQKTTYELARVIADGLREQEYLKNPNVVVSIKQYNSRAFFIQGAVNRPGLYQIESRPSLLTMIGLAGGLSENHGSTVFILRPHKFERQAGEGSNIQNKPPVQTQTLIQSQKPNPNPNSQSREMASDFKTVADYELIKVNLSGLYKGQFDQNQRLEPGDIVNIPRADLFFVAGEVQAPGSFTLKDGTTLRQAISLAQGTTFKAKTSQGMIFREDPVTGLRQEIKVDISKVMKGKKEDILIKANDVIIVPNSQSKTVGGTLLMTLGSSLIRVPY